MGLIHFQPSRRNSPFEIRQMQPTSAATLTLGEPVARDATDDEQIVAHAGGSTVTGLVGFAMAPVTSGTPGFGTTIPVAIANEDTEYMGQLINAGSIVTPVAATHEGVSYGMIESSNNWYVDVADTTDVVFRVTKVLPDINAVLFKIIASVIGL